MEGFFHGAKILLAHFHFVCRGAVPLSVNWRDPETSNFAKLDKEQVSFLESIQLKIKESGMTHLPNSRHRLFSIIILTSFVLEQAVMSFRAKHKYESYLYWSHQLFFDNWKPGVTHIFDEIP